MKYRITSVSEPTDDIELQKVKDAKSFTRSLMGIAASISIGDVGVRFYTSVISSGDYSIVPVALGMATQIIAHGVVTPKLISHLYDLYKRKGNENEVSNTMSGGIKR